MHYSGEATVSRGGSTIASDQKYSKSFRRSRLEASQTSAAQSLVRDESSPQQILCMPWHGLVRVLISTGYTSQSSDTGIS